jgi:hypothetical protein
MDPELVDRIYECAFMPDRWPSALGELAAIATARTGFLFVSKGEIHRVASSTDFGLAIKPLVESGMIAKTERSRRLLTARDSRFLTEAELYPSGDSADDPSYQSRRVRPSREKRARCACQANVGAPTFATTLARGSQTRRYR